MRPLRALLLSVLLCVPVLASGQKRSEPQALPPLEAAVLQLLPPDIRTEVENGYRLLREIPGNGVLAGQLAMILHAHGQFEVAEQFYSYASLLAPNEFGWIYLRAVVQELNSREAEAVDSLRLALQVDPGYLPARLRLGQLLAETGKWEDTEAVYREILEQFPKLPLGHFGLGRALSELGRTAEASEQLERACELYPEFGQAHYVLAQLYRRSNDIDRAKRHLELYQKYRLTRPAVGDGFLETVDQLKSGSGEAFRHLSRGVELGEGGKLDEAIAESLKALEINPQLVQAYVNLVILYGKAGRVDEAEDAYRRALELGGQSDRLHYNFGVLMVQTGRYDEAFEALQRAERLNPNAADIQNSLGHLAERLQKLDLAEKHYRNAAQSDPKDRSARLNLARMMLARSGNREAIAELETILTPEDEQTPIILFALGTAWVREGDLERGISLSEQAAELARKYNQQELATSIDRNLEGLRAGKTPPK